MPKKACLGVCLLFWSCLLLLRPISVPAAAEPPAAYPLPAMSGKPLEDFLAVAESQVGYTATESNESIYWKWAGSVGKTTSWCSEFVAWCGAMAGVSEYVPLRWSSKGFREYYAAKNAFFSITGGCHDDKCGCAKIAGAELAVGDLKAGDIILWDTDNNLSNGPDHTAIVFGVDANYIYTIDGNAHKDQSPAGSVAKRKRSSDKWGLIHGICRPFDQARNEEPAAVKAATIRQSAKTIRRGRAKTVKVTCNSGAKLTVKAKNAKAKYAKKKRTITLKSGKTAKLVFRKKAAKGTYTFTVTSPAKGIYGKTKKTITVRVK